MIDYTSVLLQSYVAGLRAVEIVMDHRGSLMLDQDVREALHRRAASKRPGSLNFRYLNAHMH